MEFGATIVETEFMNGGVVKQDFMDALKAITIVFFFNRFCKSGVIDRYNRW